MQHVVAEGEPKLAFACIDGTVARGRANRYAESAIQSQGRRRQAGSRPIPRRSEVQDRRRLRRPMARLVDFVLVPGQAHELAPSLELLARLPRAPARALADMA